MITLTHLRALLERALTHTTNPAILRLSEGERSVEGLSKACLKVDLTGPVAQYAPSYFYAVTAALALAIGMNTDSRSIRWRRLSRCCWVLDNECDDGRVDAVFFMPRGIMPDGGDGFRVRAWWFLAPVVAAEPDPVRAIALAVAHVLEAAP